MAGDSAEPGPTLVPAEGDDPILASVRIPEDWTATILTRFSGHAPAFIAATPEGDLFLSVREDGGGRILKLAGKNWAGKAGEIHEFVPHLDSPRGLTWDGQWLYVIDASQLIAIRDTDSDQVADEDRVLAEGLTDAWGITLGIDGWLYLAIGKNGAAGARGADGSQFQLRGGGVARIRPDGSGLHVFSRGAGDLREVAITPRLEVLANGTPRPEIGWQAGLHSFSGLDHHGFPELFRRFPEEHLEPLSRATSTGGASLFLSEPAVPDILEEAMLTAIPEANTILSQRFSDSGSVIPLPIASLPGPFDLDGDAHSRLYISGRVDGSGFVIMLDPPHHMGKVAKLLPAPIGAEMPNSSLIYSLQAGTRNRLRVQQALLRRDLTLEDLDTLEELAGDERASLDTRIAALFTAKLAFGERSNVALTGLATDPSLTPFALRALGDFPSQTTDLQPDLFRKALQSNDSRTRQEAILAVTRLEMTEFVPELATLGGSDDPRVAHMGVNALAELGETARYFEILEDLDNYKQWPGLFRALARLPTKEVVDGLISGLAKTESSLYRAGALKALARLYRREAEWDGSVSDALPDTGGPWIEPVTWERSQPIAAAMEKALEDRRVNKTFLLTEIARNRIPFDDFDTLLTLTAVTPELEQPAVTLILERQRPPQDSLPFLTFVATNEERPSDLRMEAATGLARSFNDMAVSAAFRLTHERDAIGGIPRLRDQLKQTLLDNPSHPSRYDWLLEEAHGPGDEAGILAWTILLKLSQTGSGLSPAARAEVEGAIARVPQWPRMLRRFLLATADFKFRAGGSIVREALNHPDESVVEAARKAAAALDIEVGSD